MKSITESAPCIVGNIERTTSATAILPWVVVSSEASLGTEHLIDNENISAPTAAFTRTIQKTGQQSASLEMPFVRNVIIQLQSTASTEQTCQAHAILNQLKHAVSGTAKVDELPPIHITKSEDTLTIFLDWIFPKARVGFNIETDSRESGWYLLIEQPNGELKREWGYLESFDASHVVSHVLSH